MNGAGVAFLLLAVITLVPTWREAGWPASHEGIWFAQRTWVYARHYSWFDLLPIWASVDAWGYGSPMPLAYHKLFYMVAAPVALAVGSIKPALVLTLALLMTAGAVGVAQTLRALGGSRLSAFVGGCCLITANYTVTNWLVRGAMAELAGAMLAPWVFYYFVRSLAARQLQIGLGIALGLVWLAHSVLAYFIVLVLGTTYLVLAAGGIASWALLDPKTAWRSVASFSCFVVPYLIPLAILGPAYDFSRIIAPPFRPPYQFRPTHAYFWDTKWSALGEKTFGVTVQLDHAMLVLLAAGLCALGARRLWSNAESRRASAVAVLPLLVVLFVCFSLQLPIAAAAYEIVPGAAFIQFPWRLLALMTPALVVVSLRLADGLVSPLRLFCLGAAGAWMCASSIALAPMPLKRVALDPLPLTQVEFSYPALHEYEPRAAYSLPTLEVTIADAWAQAGCSYTVERGAGEEVPEAVFAVECAAPTLLPLPLYASPLHRVRLNASRPAACASVPRFAAVCGAALPAGTNRVAVTLPSMASLTRWGWDLVLAISRR